MLSFGFGCNQKAPTGQQSDSVDVVDGVDTASDVLPDKESQSDGLGLSDVSDVSSGDALAPSVECKCADERFDCRPLGDELKCVLSTEDAGGCGNGGKNCPPGSMCNSDGQCVCAQRDAGAGCKPRCSSDGTCPGQFRCNESGICEPPEDCLFHNECPKGRWCVSWKDEYGSHCLDLSDRRPAGTECSDDSECRSGSCSQTCQKRCQTPKDCPDGNWCLSSGICAEYKPEPCMTECHEDEYCSGRNFCLSAVCRRSSDCPDSDCLKESTRGLRRSDVLKSTGQCGVKTNQLCEGREFRITPDDPFCRLTQACEYHNDCPSGYFCSEPTNNRAWRGTCARRVAPWPWPPGE